MSIPSPLPLGTSCACSSGASVAVHDCQNIIDNKHHIHLSFTQVQSTQSLSGMRAIHQEVANSPGPYDLDTVPQSLDPRSRSCTAERLASGSADQSSCAAGRQATGNGTCKASAAEAAAEAAANQVLEEQEHQARQAQEDLGMQQKELRSIHERWVAHAEIIGTSRAFYDASDFWPGSDASRILD